MIEEHSIKVDYFRDQKDHLRSAIKNLWPLLSIILLFIVSVNLEINWLFVTSFFLGLGVLSLFFFNQLYCNTDLNISKEVMSLIINGIQYSYKWNDIKKIEFFSDKAFELIPTTVSVNVELKNGNKFSFYIKRHKWESPIKKYKRLYSWLSEMPQAEKIVVPLS